MARLPRYFLPDTPYHITQRGNNRQPVFLTDADRRTYLKLLHETAAPAGIRLLAFCLMTNHVHFIALPAHADSLPTWLRRLQGRYAQYFNFVHHHSGHLWQGRYFACALDEAHLWRAIRYVERNPVRAHITPTAAAYSWSSAAAHLSGDDYFNILDMDFWRDHDGATRWPLLLEEADDAQFVHDLQHYTYTGRPCGSTEFTTDIEQRTGRKLPTMYTPRRTPAQAVAS